MNNQFEIRKHTVGPRESEYLSIFRDGQKTNFWAPANDPLKIDQLNRCFTLLKAGIIDPSAEDICSFVKWKPKNYQVLYWENISEKQRDQIRKNWQHDIHSFGGLRTDREEKEYIKRGLREELTQYSKILNDDLTAILPDVLIIIYPYGATYQATDLTPM